MASTRMTTDHETIRRWAEERQGHPAAVKGTGTSREPGVLRIDFGERRQDDRLEEISWEEFFEKFDRDHMAFLYQQEVHGDDSRFFRLVSRALR